LSQLKILHQFLFFLSLPVGDHLKLRLGHQLGSRHKGC
jgi:hypothetical protein